MSHTRVTVTLPAPLVDEIDRTERNRSRFVLEAVRRELERRKQKRLRESLDHAHDDSGAVAESGLAEWAAALPDESDDLVIPGAGRPIRWEPGKGWQEG